MRTPVHVAIALLLVTVASCKESASPTAVSTTDAESLIRAAAKAAGGVKYVLSRSDDGQVAPVRLLDLTCRVDANDPSKGNERLVEQGVDTLTLRSDGTARLRYDWQNWRDGVPDTRTPSPHGEMLGTWTVIQGQPNWEYYGASSIVRLDLGASADRPAHQELYKIHDANTLSRYQSYGGGCYNASGELVSYMRNAGFFFTRQ